jgi:hypothetical protein
MAWNQPLRKKETIKTTHGLKVFLGLVLGLGLCIVFVILYFSNTDSVVEVDRTPQKINTKTQSKNTRPKEKTQPLQKAPKKKTLSKLEQGIYVDERGIKRYPGGLRVTEKGEKITPRVDFNKLNPPRFKNIADEQIAKLIEIEPGAGVFGTIPYGETFDKRFIESLKEEAPLVDLMENETRSEYDIELQKCVLDAKKEMLQRYQNGEKPSSIMAETRAELQRLGQYTHQLRQQVFEIMRDEQYSDQDVQDFKSAANEMLRKKGLPELKFPSMVFRQHYINNKRASQK